MNTIVGSHLRQSGHVHPQLGEHDTWDTLLPAVYGVSVQEFEAGSHAYLEAEYGIELDQGAI